MISFDWPWIFLCLPLPALAYFFIPRAKVQNTALHVPFFSRIQSIQGHSSERSAQKQWLNLIALTLIWLCLVIATAKPMQAGEPIALPTTGRDLMLAVDFSGSMERADMVVQNQRYPRYMVVKYIIGEFLEKRQGDRVGLILFGTNAYLQAPLTFDLKTVNTYLQEAPLRIAGEGTAIGDAIGLAVKRLKERPESQRILILLTDGENTAGNVLPQEAAELAAKAGIKIHTIGFSPNRGTRQLDETTLSDIANLTGGMYFRARNPAELQNIYAELDKLEKIEQDKDFYRPSKSLFYLPLGLSLILSALFMILQVIPTRSLSGGSHA